MRVRPRRRRGASPRRCGPLGYDVWRDDELPAHRSYAEVIEERLASAKAVVVLWSAEAAKSEWVQSEADRARANRKLVQLRLDGAALPMPFDRIQCADLAGWDGRRGRGRLEEGGRVDLRAGRRGCDRPGRSVCDGPDGEGPVGDGPGGGAQRQHLRAAVRQHERRGRAGLLQRRDQRGHHHRPLQGLGARGRLPQHRLHLQGQERRRAGDRRPARRHPRAGGQRPQGRRPGPDHRAADRRRRGPTTSGPTATTATSTTSSRCRTRSARPSWRR